MADKLIPLSDAEKKLLSDRYLDLEFEEDIHDFICVKCNRLAIVHFFTNCGHLLCLNCKKNIDSGGFTCSQCNTLITNASEQRDEFERRLLALRTKCPNTNYGCQFTTNLAQIPVHVGTCKSTRDAHLALCIKKIKDMEQQEMQLKDKELSNIQLPKSMDPIEKFLRHKSSIVQLVDSFLFGLEDEQMIFESLCLKWNIKNFGQLITAGGSHEHLSDIFPVYGCQLKTQLRLAIYSGGYIDLYLCFKDREREGQDMDIKPLPMVTFIIKDLSGHNKHLIRYRHYPFKKSLEYNEFGYGMGLNKYDWNRLISPRDKSMEVLVLVEPYTIINNPLSVNGTMMDTIQHYGRKLQMERKGLIDGHWSAPFLTHAGGFRVAVCMHLDEPVGNKRGLEAWVNFLSGEFDSQLGTEFKFEISITLISVWNAEKNITVRKQINNTNAYRIEIASVDEIGSAGLIVNDLLTYHMTIKPIQYLGKTSKDTNQKEEH